MDHESLPHWQESFIDEVVGCSATVYLKQRYLERNDSTVSRRRIGSRKFKQAGWILFATLAVLFVPVPFRLAVEGNLMPVEHIGVFSPFSGTLISIEVQDSQTIQKGDVLARVDSPEIELQRDRLRGELLAAQTELSSLRMMPRRSSSSPNYADDSTNLTSDLSATPSTQTAVLRVRIASLERQVDLIDQIHDSLTIRAPRGGMAVIRDAQSELVGQHVMQSQWLLSVVEPNAGYQAVIDLPSNAYGYLAEVATDQAPPSTAALRLRANPSRAFTGRVSQIGTTVHYRPDGNGFVPITLSIDSDSGSSDTGDLEELPIEAPVVGHLSFGKRPLGFVFFRPVVEAFRSWGW